MSPTAEAESFVLLRLGERAGAAPFGFKGAGFPEPDAPVSASLPQ